MRERRPPRASPSSPRRAFRLVALPAIVLALAACGGDAGSTIELGGPLPSFVLPDLDGHPVRSEELVGEPTVLSFWATWCQPCLREIPLLEALEADPRFRLVTVALDDGGHAAVAPFAAERRLPYPILIGDRKTFERLGGMTIPYAILLTPDGRVADIVRGSLRRERVEALLLSSVDGSVQ